MADFYNAILKAISDYKLILRKTLSPNQCAAKMQELGIKRNHIKNIDEAGLYEIGFKIIADLKKHTSAYKGKRSVNFYLGAQEFLRYLEELFAKNKLENGKIVHVGQVASCALVAAIQLITLPKERLTQEVAQQIMKHGDVIIMYGSEEQKKIFNDALESNEVFLESTSPRLR